MGDKNGDNKGKQGAGGGKRVEMPTSAIGKLKQAAYQRGHAEALAQIDKMAKAANFESFADMATKLGRMVNGKGTPAAAPTGASRGGSGAGRGADAGKGARGRNGRQTPRDDDAGDDPQDRLSPERQALADAEHERAVLSLELKATKLGIRNPDFAVHKLMEKVQRLSREDALKLNEDEFFRDLQRTQPDVFGKPAEDRDNKQGSGEPDKGKQGDKANADEKDVEKRPAQTVAATGGKPTPAKTGEDGEKIVDVLTMSADELAAYKAKHGLR